MSPKISIVIPVYNTGQYLPRCLDSILSQSFTDFELLLIDDGSTDGSGDICDKYAANDYRVRVFHKENGGVCSARNVGLDNAMGEWVWFVDSDDELMPDGMKVMIEGESNNVDLVMAGYKVYDDKGFLTYSIETNHACLLNTEQAVKEMYAPSHYWYQGYIWCKLMRLLVVKENKIRFSEELFFNEDRLFVTQYICAMENEVFYTTKPVYQYVEHSESAMMSLNNSFNIKFVTDFQAQIRMRESVRTRFKNKELLELADYEVYKSYRRITGMMKKFHYEDETLRKELHKQLVKTLGIWTYALFETMRNMRRILKKI